MRTTAFPSADIIAMIDVMQYVSAAEQDEILGRARAALGAGGVLLLRVADAARTGGFRRSSWIDRAVIILRGGGWFPPLAGRSLAAWERSLQALGFSVEVEPMSGGLPFANVLLVARVPKTPPP
jgi:hypothetical protein